MAAPRSIGSLTISFGLIAIPVKLYTATQSANAISFNMLHKSCGSRLKQQYICQKEGVVVERDDIEVVVSYMEGIADGRRLRNIGRRALARRKPILVWKAGNSGIGRAAATSHTASMTADYALYREAFREGGGHPMAEIAFRLGPKGFPREPAGHRLALPGRGEAEEPRVLPRRGRRAAHLGLGQDAVQLGGPAAAQGSWFLGAVRHCRSRPAGGKERRAGKRPGFQLVTAASFRT